MTEQGGQGLGPSGAPAPRASGPDASSPRADLGIAGAGGLGGSLRLDPSDSKEEKLPKQFGKYTLLRKLAAGGMAELFLALHRSVAGFEKLVVIKRILPLMNQDRQFIDMLLHEARVAATLSHANIVQTFDVGQFDGTYFIAMEHIHGEDIRTIVRQMKKANVSEFPIEHALHIVVGLSAGLAYAHDKRDLDGKLLGIVHRDISPQNIVVTFSGDVKVVDFGVAKSLHANEESKGGQLKGKVPYMSPEQAGGEEIDHRSDIFAAGVILFELTTGKRLFKGGSEYDTLRIICESEYPMPSDVAPGYPAELERIVMKALAKNRDARYQSARDLQADLEAFIRNERMPVSPVSMSKWMEMLFADKIEQQKAALHDIKQLADEIAAQFPVQEYAPTSTGSHPHFDQSTTGAAAPGAAATIPPQKRSSGLLVGLVGLLLIAVAGVGFYVWRTNQAAKADASSPTQPVASAPVVEAEPKGSIKFESDPPGASIWLNGDLQKDVTPTTIDNLPIGHAIMVKLSKEGLESHRQSVTLEKNGDTQTVSAKMHVGSVSVDLVVVPEPSVWVDGSPWKGDPKHVTGLSADDEHKIVVSAVGYVPKTFTFTGKQGEKTEFKHFLVRMTPEQLAALQADRNKDKPKPGTDPTSTAAAGGTGPATVRVNARPGYCANVVVNGASLGPTPVSTTVPAGTVRISCKTPDGKTLGQGAKADPGQTVRVTFSVE